MLDGRLGLGLFRGHGCRVSWVSFVSVVATHPQMVSKIMPTPMEYWVVIA
jgi:hypothetical protein